MHGNTVGSKPSHYTMNECMYYIGIHRYSAFTLLPTCSSIYFYPDDDDDVW